MKHYIYQSALILIGLLLAVFTSRAQTADSGFSAGVDAVLTYPFPEATGAFTVGAGANVRYSLPIGKSKNAAVVFGAGADIAYHTEIKQIPDKKMRLFVGFDCGWKPIRIMPLVCAEYMFTYYRNIPAFIGAIELRWNVSPVVRIALSGGMEINEYTKGTIPGDGFVRLGLLFNIKDKH